MWQLPIRMGNARNRGAEPIKRTIILPESEIMRAVAQYMYKQGYAKEGDSAKAVFVVKTIRSRFRLRAVGRTINIEVTISREGE
jgi:ribosomal protein S8